ncbi:MAG: hypothetical protein IJA34_07350 [Lachnospiraceae bacterium]|nr:hypothetical protein [Lachnospiraceae bacterium]
MENKFVKFKDVMTEGLLYKFLWKRNFLTKIIYIIIPFVLIVLFGLIIYFRKAYDMNNGYDFLSDYTNCYMLCYIFFFMYFVCGLFVPYLSNRVKEFGEKVPIEISEKYDKNRIKAKWFLSFGSVIVSGFAIPFIYVASKTGDMY